MTAGGTGDLRHRQCGHKVRYSSQAVAANADQALEWADGTRMCTYQCPRFEYWHLATDRRSTRRGAA
jgi:hypothetical protein